MKLIISLLALTIPYIWEIWNDRNGEAVDAKVKDVVIRVLLSVAAALVGWCLIDKPIIDGAILALAFHWMAFDYTIAAILIGSGIVEPGKAETWFTYLGKTAATDKFKLWREMKPWTRFFVRLGVLIGAIITYWI